MADSNSVKSLFSENSENEALSAAEVLLKIANNILSNPDNPKYRSLKVGNAVVLNKLLPFAGAMECLFEMGFEEGSENLTFPPGNSGFQKLRRIRDKLEAERQLFKTKGRSQQNRNTQQPVASSASQVAPGPGASTVGGACAATPTTPSAAPIPQAQGPQGATASSQPFSAMQQQLRFYGKLTSQLEHVTQYEDATLQAKARECIPIETLTKNTRDKLVEIKRENSSADVDQQDLFLLELLSWFKRDFFRWCDSPACVTCSGVTRAVGRATPIPSERHHGASVVENYICDKCQQHTRFPRYNDPGKLLETRRGRCGEWANCFTLCCRAVGLEARFVLDWTDHVWTEVYSMAQKRWLHCDPCENKCDKPLIYESGWGKKLSYIIAFSTEGLQDVTWRYSARHAEVLSRRKECDEKWLVETICRINKNKLAKLGETRRAVLLERLLLELIELMAPKTAGEGENTGRESGSMAWRLARGETGSTPSPREPVLITPTPSEVTQRCLHIRYCCASDQYVRVSNGSDVTRGWGHMTHEVSHVMRKEESDWRMVYLARTEGSAEASIAWKFDFTGTDLAVDTVDVSAVCERFESGQILWRVCGDTSCSFLPPDGARTHVTDLAGSRTVTLTAHMRGGEGEVAWQHTQLFRQGMDEKDVYPLDVKIALKKV